MSYSGRFAAGLTTLRERFARVTSTGEFIPQVDGLRFFAILLVVGHHVVASYLVHTHRLGTQTLPQDWGLIYARSRLVPWALNLAFGVPLFCVISGFVLTIPFAKRYLKRLPPPSRKLYFLRRLIRLEPPYVLSLVVLFLAILIPWGDPHPIAFVRDRFLVFFPHFLASLFYLHGAIYGQGSWINGVAWTLEIEVQFYLVLPLLAQVFRIHRTGPRRGLLLAIILASAVFAQLVLQPNTHPHLSLSLLLQLQFFVAGILLADLYLNPPRFLTMDPLRSDMLALSSALLLITVVHFIPRYAWTESILIAAMYLGIFSGRWTARLLQFPVFTLLGGISYTTYLYHFFIIDQLMPVTIRLFPPVHSLLWDVSVQFLLMLPPIFGICAILYVWTEKPFMVLGRRVAQRYRRAPSTVTAA